MQTTNITMVRPGKAEDPAQAVQHQSDESFIWHVMKLASIQ